MMLVNLNLLRAVTKACLFCTVKKDDVNIIKMFYDIPSMVRYYTELYNTSKSNNCLILYHNRSRNIHNIPQSILEHNIMNPTSQDCPILLSLFDVHFTVSGVLAINSDMMPQYNTHHSSHLTNVPYQHNTKFFAVPMDAEIAANMAYFYTRAYKKDIFFV